MAKRHFGEVITNYDPDNSEARKLFKKAKTLLKDLNAVREVCACKYGACTAPGWHPFMYAPWNVIRPKLASRPSIHASCISFQTSNCHSGQRWSMYVSRKWYCFADGKEALLEVC
jgi:hypothetical protein